MYVFYQVLVESLSSNQAFLLFSQSVPKYPGAHTQVNSLTPSTHVDPCPHGESAQSSMLMLHVFPLQEKNYTNCIFGSVLCILQLVHQQCYTIHELD